MNTVDRHIGKVFSLTQPISYELNNNQNSWKSWIFEKMSSLIPCKEAYLSTLNNHGINYMLKTIESDFDLIESKSEEVKYKPSNYSLMLNWPEIRISSSVQTENSYENLSIFTIIYSSFSIVYRYFTNKINISQLRAYYDKKFYFSNYEINSDSKKEQLNLINNAKNVDYFLCKLKDVNFENLSKNGLMNSQLKELKSSFNIERKLNEPIKIVSDKLHIIKIKEIMIRLLDVYNDSLIKYLESAQNINKNKQIIVNTDNNKQYQIIEEIGEGAQAIVFKGLDLSEENM